MDGIAEQTSTPTVDPSPVNLNPVPLPPARPWRVFGVFFLAVLALSLLITWRTGAPIVGMDDANIFFVYARNLAHGHGMVYNAGGPRVEGFSSLLWLLVITPFFALMESPEPALFLLSVALTALALTVLYHLMIRLAAHLCRPIALGRKFALLAAIWCLASPGFLTWTTLSLMDTGLWMCLNMLLFTTAIKLAINSDRAVKSPFFGVLIVLMLMARPESTLVVFLLLAGLTLFWGWERTPGWIGASAMFWVVFGLAQAALFGFRMAYFGYPFPNTYYAKVSPDRLYNLVQGMRYLYEFTRWNPLVLLGLLGAGVGVLGLGLRICFQPRIFKTHRLLKLFLMLRADKTLKVFGLVGAPLVIGLLPPLVGGGDHFMGFRFYQPYWPWILPPVIFGTLWGNDNNLQKDHDAPRFDESRFSPRDALVVILFFFFAAAGADSWIPTLVRGSEVLKNEVAVTVCGRQVGEILSGLTRRPVSIGVITAGGIAWSYDGAGSIFDTMGLNDPVVAHAPGERKGVKNHAAFSTDQFWRRHPEIFHPLHWPLKVRPGVPLPHEPGSWYYESDMLHGLLNQPRFRAEYQPALIGLRYLPGQFVFAYWRRDFLPTLNLSKIAIQPLGEHAWP